MIISSYGTAYHIASACGKPKYTEMIELNGKTYKLIVDPNIAADRGQCIGCVFDTRDDTLCKKANALNSCIKQDDYDFIFVEVAND